MFSQEFDYAFHHAMLYEVGKFWNPKDQAVISGDISSVENRRKVGYVNIPEDRGGETKYGIAQKSNPEISVRGLDLNEAMSVYYKKYWLAGKNDYLKHPLSIMHFDGCVNHGVKRAVIFLQRGLGMPQETGVFGNITMSLVGKADVKVLITNIAGIRRRFYNNIVKNDPTQNKFLRGWLKRIDEVESYTLSFL